MKYTNKLFVVGAPTNATYRDNWEATFAPQQCGVSFHLFGDPKQVQCTSDAGHEGPHELDYSLLA